MILTDFLRVFIIVASIVATVLIVAINHPHRRVLSFSHVMTRMGTCGLLLSVAYATFESHVRNVPGAPRLWFLAAGLVWLNVGCIATFLERRKLKKRKGSD